jgi:maltose O-acetyltransferase
MWERMRAGALYLADDPRLREEHLRGQRLLEQYNATSATEAARRALLLHELLGTCGQAVTVVPPLRADYGRHIHVGDATFINYDCVMLDAADITIGSRCQIAPRVTLTTSTHPLDPAARAAGWESAAPIDIGDNVWLAAGVIVLPGVRIGDDSVIGAGATVTQDIPAGVLALGTPARVVRDLDA